MDLIETLQLTPHPEGGYYRRTYCSSQPVKLPDGRKRYASSSIYYYLASDDFSAWHRIRPDEMWHHYQGSPLKTYLLHDNGELTCHCVGAPSTDPLTTPQFLIPSNTWWAAEVAEQGGYALIGCSVAPSFDFDDFEIAKRDELIKQYPQHKDIIQRLTRQ